MVDFTIEPEFQAKLDWMEEFVRDKVYPLEYLYDYDKDAPYDVNNLGLRKIIKHLQKEVQAQGMWAAHLPRHLGGSGFGAVKLTYMNERFGFSGFGPVIFGCQGPDSGNSEILAMFGTPEQKERFLKPLLANERRVYNAISEPGTGSNIAQLQTRADLKGDHYVLNGRKMWITNGAFGDFGIVVARTFSPDCNGQLSTFLVEQAVSPCEVRRVDTMVLRSTGTAELNFDNVKVPRENLLGQEGNALKKMLVGLDGARYRKVAELGGTVIQPRTPVSRTAEATMPAKGRAKRLFMTRLLPCARCDRGGGMRPTRARQPAVPSP